jgi:hypothetical protein
MKTLTVHIYQSSGEEAAWIRMSSSGRMEKVSPETGGPLATELELPSEPSDIATLGSLAAAAAQEAGLRYEREWSGRWDLEPSTPEDREEEAE